MMLTIVAATALIAAAAGYMVARKKGQAEPDPRAPGSAGNAGLKSSGKSAPLASPFEGLSLSLGDVVVAGGDERWLAGALVFREGKRVLSALFVSPEGAKVGAVASYALPRREIFWLEPAPVDCPPEPPMTLEIRGAMLSRRGRLPVVIERHGQGAPKVEGAAILATYDAGADEVAIVLAHQGRALAWIGRRLDEDEYDRLGHGGTGD